APNLNSADDIVLNESRLEVRRQIKLFVKEAFDAVDTDLMTRHRNRVKRSRRCHAGRNLGLGNQGVSHVVRTSNLVAERDMTVHIVLDFSSRDIVVGAEVVAVLETIVVAAWY